MNRTIIKLLGAAGCFFICLFAIIYYPAKIERDLLERCNNKLINAKIFTASVSVDGRDITLTGYVNNEQQRRSALETLMQVEGVRSVLENIWVTGKHAGEKPLDTIVGEETSAELSPLSAAIYFYPGKAMISSRDYIKLDKIARLLKRYKHLEIEIGGHTDNVGEENLNKDLSLSRANSVRGYLITKNIDPGRMRAIGYGSLYPGKKSSGKEESELNRRVEFKLSKEE